MTANMAVSWLIARYFAELSNGVVAFISYSSSALLTTIYTFAISRVTHISVPSLKIEIRKLNPRLIVAGFVLILAINIVISPLEKFIPDVYLDVLDKYMNYGFWAMLVAVAVAPIFEEFLFRGVIQTNLIAHFGVIKGIIFGAVIFGAMHIVPQQALNAAGVGLILGSIYYLTGSLNTVIAIHFINNGFTYLLFMLFSDTNQLEEYLFENTTIHIIAYATSLILLILAGGRVIYKVKSEK